MTPTMGHEKNTTALSHFLTLVSLLLSHIYYRLRSQPCTESINISLYNLQVQQMVPGGQVNLTQIRNVSL